MPPKIGVVLSSGGGRGVFGHTGFMLALDELEVPISALAGCSAGAVVGGVVASGTDIKIWAEAVQEVAVDQFWTPLSPLQLLYRLGLNSGRGFTGLSGTAAGIGFLSEHLTAKTFEQCLYPFSAVALNLGSGQKVHFNSGTLAPRMMASAAMPVLYQPLELEGQYYTDGATVDLAPADAICCRNDLDVLLIHHVAQRNYSTSEFRDALTQPWAIMNILHRLVYRRRPWYATGEPLSVHRCPCGCKARVFVVEPDLPDLTWPVTLGSDAIVQKAKTHALEQLGSMPSVFDRQPAGHAGA